MPQPTLLDPIAIPEPLNQLGYSRPVFQQKVLEDMKYISREAATSHGRTSIAVPKDLPDIQILETGISVSAVVASTQRWLHREPPRIGGEIVFDTENFTRSANDHKFKLTLHRYPGDSIDKSHSIDADNPPALVRSVSEAILEEEDPYILATYLYFTQGDKERATAIVDEMVEKKQELPWAYLFKGVAAYELGNLDEAIKFCEQALAIEPNFAPIYGNYSGMLLEKGDLGQALEIAKKGLHFKDVSRNLGFAYVNTMTRLLRRKEAIDYIRHRAERESDSMLYEVAAVAEMKDGHYDEAIADLRTAIELNPMSAQAYSEWGDALYQQNKFNVAIREYQRSIDLDPDWVSSYNFIGLCYEEQRQYDVAIRWYQSSIRQRPNARAYVHWANALKTWKSIVQTDSEKGAGKETKTARPTGTETPESLLKKAMEVDPNESMSYVEYGRLERERKGPNSAMPYFLQAIAKNPNNEEAYAEITKTLSGVNSFIPVASYLEMNVSKHPANVMANLFRGISLYTLEHKPEESIPYLQKAIALDPSKLQIYDLLATVFRSIHRYQDAESTWQKILAVDPRNANAYAGWGWDLYLEGKYDEAALRLQTAVSLDPKDFGAATHLAKVRMSQHRYAEALALYEDLSKRFPGHANFELLEADATYGLAGTLTKDPQKEKELRNAADNLKRLGLQKSPKRHEQIRKSEPTKLPLLNRSLPREPSLPRAMQHSA